MECPKCQYVRSTNETCPDYECPKCGIVYSKFDPAIAEREAALRARLLTQKPKPKDDSIGASPLNIWNQLKIFIAAPKGRFTKLSLWCGLIVFVVVLLRFAGEIGLWVLFLAPLILLLLKKTPPTKLGICRVCGGMVAYGVKSCPHCGQSKPAPKPVGKTTVVIAWVFMGMMVVVGSKTTGSSNSDGVNPANDPSVRLGAQATVQAAGYRCGTITAMTKLMIGTGFAVHCDNYRDNYTITDEGGRIHVRLD